MLVKNVAHWGRMLVTVYVGHTLVMNFLRKSEEKMIFIPLRCWWQTDYEKVINIIIVPPKSQNCNH